MDEDETEEEKKAREEKERAAADEEAKKKEDEERKAADEEAKREADEQKAKDEEERKKDDDKKAQDAAVDAKIKLALDNQRRELRAAQDAREAVRPLVGDVIGMDSAGDIYRYALKQTGHDATDVHDSALPALVSMAIDAKRPARPVRLAADSAADSDSPLAGASARRKA